VQQAVDVAAPIDVVYDQWTQFEDYPKFMHRVQRVEQRDDSHVAFHTKVWGINRMWEAEIVEQRPDERIVFKSVNGVQLTGVVTFHDMAERLTHIELNIDVDPNGPIEKIARGTRVIKRAARADLKRFKAFVEMHEDETGAWRGEIEDGEVVSESDDRDEDEYYDEPEEDQEEEEEEEPAPKRRRSSSSKSKSRSNGGDPKKRSRSASSRKSSSRSRSSNGGSSTKKKSSSSRSKSGGRK
jgi:Polyketide cyclase / dehydrase and lipid transport